MRFIFIIIFSFAMSVQFVKADHASPSFETGAAGAIMTTPGATLPRGKFVTGFGVQFIELNEFSDEQLEAFGAAEIEVHSVDNLLSVAANFAYGLTDDFTIGLSFPYLERSNVREAEHDGGAGEVELAGDANGIGDLSLFSQYRFYTDQNQDIALLTGVKTPTGDDDIREAEGALFELEQQPGSGSWDPFFGLSYNRSMGKMGISANLLYTIVTEGSQDTELGDIFNYNLAASYRITFPEGGHDHHSHEHTLGILDYIDLVLELNGDRREHVEISGSNDENTGGHTLYLSPGLRVGLAHKVSLFISVGIPIVNDLNGQQSEPDYRTIGGLSFYF